MHKARKMTIESLISENMKVFLLFFRVNRNILRWSLLLDEAHSINNKLIQNDIYRMCIVFMHATLEDFIREFAREKLANTPNEYLDKLSLSSYDNLAKLLTGKLNIDLTPFQHYLLDIDQMIKRRHAIVHNADLNEKGAPNSINLAELRKWHIATINFILELTPLIAKSAYIQSFVRAVIKEAEKDASDNEPMTAQDIFEKFNELFSDVNKSDNR